MKTSPFCFPLFSFPLVRWAVKVCHSLGFPQLLSHHLKTEPRWPAFNPCWDKAICELPYALVGPADAEQVYGIRATWRVADSQKGGTIFNLPEEDLGINRGLGLFASVMLPHHFLRNRGWFWFSFWQSKEMLWTLCSCWLKNYSLSSPTLRIHQLSRCRSLQIFIMTALSLCYIILTRRGGEQFNLSQGVCVCMCVFSVYQLRISITQLWCTVVSQEFLTETIGLYTWASLFLNIFISTNDFSN